MIRTIDTGDDVDKYGNAGEAKKDDDGDDDCDDEHDHHAMQIFFRWIDDHIMAVHILHNHG